MAVDFTVAIPTYNGEKRFPEVLDQLRLQTLPPDFSWEVIVVDNNSTDNTKKVVQSYQESGFPCPLKYIFEPQQGPSFARQRAIETANSGLIGFLDDDNIPASNWIVSAFEFAQEHPQAGAFGSQIHADFEVSPPENFHRIVAFLAITERGSIPLKYDPHKNLVPPSAGLVVRKQVWLENVPQKLRLRGGRLKGKFLTGEDIEALTYIKRAGWEIWYNPAMEITHKIPSRRLERESLIALFRCIGLSRHVTRMLGVEPWAKPFAFMAYQANDLRKILTHFLKYGTGVKTDVVAACEMELYKSSLMSPFYLWFTGYFKDS